MEYPINRRESYSGDLLIQLFQNPKNAKLVYDDLLEKRYDKSDITIMMTAETEKKYFSETDVSKTKLGSKALEGMGLGGAIGGTVGAIAASVAVLGTSIIIPGLGILVAGAFAAALMGAGAGALTGGLVGALIGLGVPDEQAKEFEAGIKAGGVVIGVYTKTHEDYNLLKEEWKIYRIKEDFIF